MTSKRSLLGMLMVGGGLVLSTWAMYHLIRTGSCASGGPYVSARPCPAGTGLRIISLMGGIFLALGGAGVAASAVLGVLWFGMFFTLSGSMALLIAVGPASPPGSATGGIIMGALFIGLMGIPPMVAAITMAGRSSDSDSDRAPSPLNLK